MGWRQTHETNKIGGCDSLLILTTHCEVMSRLQMYGYERYKYLHPKGLSREEGSLSRARQRKFGAKKRHALHKFTLAQVNPFNRDCYDCRIPDTNTAPSGAFSSYDEIAPATSGGNAVCYAFFPSVRCGYIASTNNVGASSWTWVGTTQNAVTNYTALNAQYNLYRPVAHGVRVTSGLAATTASGYVHLCLYSPSLTAGANWVLPLSVADMATCPFYKRINIASLVQDPVIYVNKYMDEAAHVYRDLEKGFGMPADSQMIQTTWGWMCVMVCIEGFPSGTNPITVEVIGHYEGQSNFGAMITDQPAEMPNAPVMAATSAITAIRDPLVNVLSAGASAAAGVASDVVEYIDSVYGDAIEGAAAAANPLAGVAVGVARRKIAKKRYTRSRPYNLRSNRSGYNLRSYQRGISGVTNLPMITNS